MVAQVFVLRLSFRIGINFVSRLTEANLPERAAASTTCGRSASFEPSLNCFSLGEAGSAHSGPCFEMAAEHRQAAGDTQQAAARNRNPTAPQESSHRHKHNRRARGAARGS